MYLKKKWAHQTWGINVANRPFIICRNETEAEKYELWYGEMLERAGSEAAQVHLGLRPLIWRPWSKIPRRAG